VLFSIFDKEFIKKNIFETQLSKWLHEAFDLVSELDYSELSKYHTIVLMKYIKMLKFFLNK